MQNLADVTHLELTVDTTDQSVARIGEFCPNLTQLKLNDSVVQSIRDLGTGVRHLQVLWLSRCGVTDLDGIGILDNLRELYLSFNNIADVAPLSMHEHLEVTLAPSAAVGRVCACVCSWAHAPVCVFCVLCV
jgi:Leucine-rich repeat (LRR) protein